MRFAVVEELYRRGPPWSPIQSLTNGLQRRAPQSFSTTLGHLCGDCRRETRAINDFKPAVKGPRSCSIAFQAKTIIPAPNGAIPSSLRYSGCKRPFLLVWIFAQPRIAARKHQNKSWGFTHQPQWSAPRFRQRFCRSKPKPGRAPPTSPFPRARLPPNWYLLNAKNSGFKPTSLRDRDLRQNTNFCGGFTPVENRRTKPSGDTPGLSARRRGLCSGTPIKPEQFQTPGMSPKGR